MQKLSPRAVAVQRVRLLLVWAGFSFAGGLILCFHTLTGVVWLSLFFAAAVYCLFFFIPAVCRAVAFEMTDGMLVVRKGVFIKKIILLHRDRVQYVRLVQTPAARLHHTASLIFYLAGSAFYLGELDAVHAKTLQEVFCHETRT